MITRTEWKPVHEAMTELDGELPTAEEMLAYRRGELPPAAEERVREQLVRYPELARAVAQSSVDDPRPGDPDYLSEQELGVHWQSLQNRIHADRPEGGRVLQFWRISTAMAAMLAVLFGALLWKAQSELRQPVHAVVWERQDLRRGGTRGPSEDVVLRTPRNKEVLLVLPLMPQPQFAGYRLELVEVTGPKPRVVFDDTDVTATDSDTVEVLVQPERLEAGGRYEFVLYGVDGGREERLGTYSFRVPSR
jgi:hypothetical protein